MQRSKIKGRMAELNIKQKDVARVWGCAEPTANQKLNGVRPMDLDEADSLAKLLRFTPLEYYQFFLKKKLHSAIYNAIKHCNKGQGAGKVG